MKNQIQYGGSQDQEPAALAKIQHLEELVFDLEASERRLKRVAKDQNERETKLRCKIEELETENNLNVFSASGKVSVSDKERHWELLQTIRTLESSKLEIKDKVTQQHRDDLDAMTKVSLLLWLINLMSWYQ